MNQAKRTGVGTPASAHPVFLLPCPDVRLSHPRMPDNSKASWIRGRSHGPAEDPFVVDLTSLRWGLPNVCSCLLRMTSPEPIASRIPIQADWDRASRAIGTRINLTETPIGLAIPVHQRAAITIRNRPRIGTTIRNTFFSIATERPLRCSDLRSPSFFSP